MRYNVCELCSLLIVQGQLEETFGNLHVWLAAENGIFVRPPPTHAELKPVGLLSLPGS